MCVQFLLPKTAAVIPQNSFTNRKEFLKRWNICLNGSHTGVTTLSCILWVILHLPISVSHRLHCWLSQKGFVVWRVLLSRESPWAPSFCLFIPWYLLYLVWNAASNDLWPRCQKHSVTPLHVYKHVAKVCFAFSVFFFYHACILHIYCTRRMTLQERLFSICKNRVMLPDCRQNPAQ